MRFIADTLKEFQCAALMRKAEWFFFAGTIDFFKFFGEAEDGDVTKTKLFQLGTGGVELAFAAINEDEVGRTGS